jgi:glutaconate CoA-transferase subunit B
VFVMLRHSRRAFVEQLDFATSRGERVRYVVTDLGVLEPLGGELTLTRIHPGATLEQARAATGWDLAVAPHVGETEPPSQVELAAIRELRGEE